MFVYFRFFLYCYYFCFCVGFGPIGNRNNSFALFCVIIWFLCLFFGHPVLGRGNLIFCLLYFELIISFSFGALVSRGGNLICVFTLSQACYSSVLGSTFVLVF
jgi:hypothetical protein